MKNINFIKGIIIGFIVGLFLSSCSDFMLLGDDDSFEYNQLGDSPYNPMYVKIIN